MRSAGTDSLDPSVLRGAPTRRTFPFEANGITSTERSTSRERRSTFSYAVTAALRQCRLPEFLAILVRLRNERVSGLFLGWVYPTDVSVPSSFIKLVQHRHSFRCGLIWSKVSISQGRDGRCVTKKILNFH